MSDKRDSNKCKCNDFVIGNCLMIKRTPEEVETFIDQITNKPHDATPADYRTGILQFWQWLHGTDFDFDPRPNENGG